LLLPGCVSDKTADSNDSGIPKSNENEVSTSDEDRAEISKDDSSPKDTAPISSKTDIGSPNSNPIDTDTSIDTGSPAADKELPLLCAGCSPIAYDPFEARKRYENDDDVPFGSPPCPFIVLENNLGLEEAEARGYPVSEFIDTVTAEYSIPVRWRTKDQKTLMTVNITPTRTYTVVQVEELADGAPSPESCMPPYEYLSVGIEVDINTDDGSFLGTLNGSAPLQKNPVIEYTRFQVWDSSAILRGNLKIDFDNKTPNGILAVLNMVVFPSGEPKTRLALDLFAHYSESPHKDDDPANPGGWMGLDGVGVTDSWFSVMEASSFTGCLSESALYGEACVEHPFVEDSDTD
jgi:hypothetical protein